MTEAMLSESATDLDAVLAKYSIGQVINITSASHGIENLNFFVNCQDGDRSRSFVLTQVMQPSFSGSAYLPMMAHLEAQGLPIPAPLPNKSGQTATIEDGQLCLLQPKLAGQHPVNPTNRQIH